MGNAVILSSATHANGNAFAWWHRPAWNDGEERPATTRIGDTRSNRGDKHDTGIGRRVQAFIRIISSRTEEIRAPAPGVCHNFKSCRIRRGHNAKIVNGQKRALHPLRATGCVAGSKRPKSG